MGNQGVVGGLEQYLRAMEAGSPRSGHRQDKRKDKREVDGRWTITMPPPWHDELIPRL